MLAAVSSSPYYDTQFCNHKPDFTRSRNWLFPSLRTPQEGKNGQRECFSLLPSLRHHLLILSKPSSVAHNARPLMLSSVSFSLAKSCRHPFSEHGGTTVGGKSCPDLETLRELSHFLPSGGVAPGDS